MGSYEAILYEKQRGGVLITLNEPQNLNALSPTIRRDLDAALEEAKADPEIRAIVITGAGRAFSAGAYMRTSRSGREVDWPAGIAPGMSAAEHIDSYRHPGSQNDQMYRWEFPKPIIAAVNGWALGAGSWLALTCHLTIASEEAVFAQPEVRHISATNFIWTLTAGFKHALRYGLTGDHIDAQEALRIGIVNKVVPKEQLLEECFGIVERIAKVSPETIQANLQVATLGLEMMGLNQALILGGELGAIAHASRREEFARPLSDAFKRGGVRAMLEVRDGPFQPEPFGPRSKKPSTDKE